VNPILGIAQRLSRGLSVKDGIMDFCS